MGFLQCRHIDATALFIDQAGKAGAGGENGGQLDMADILARKPFDGIAARHQRAAYYGFDLIRSMLFKK